MVAAVARSALIDEGERSAREDAPPPVDPATLPEILTVKEAADLLRINPATMRKLIREGRIPHAVVGGQYRLNKTRLLAWVAGEAFPQQEKKSPLD